MKSRCATASILLLLPCVLGRHLEHDAIEQGGLIRATNQILQSGDARGLRNAGDGVDMRKFDNLRLVTRVKGTRSRSEYGTESGRVTAPSLDQEDSGATARIQTSADDSGQGSTRNDTQAAVDHLKVSTIESTSTPDADEDGEEDYMGQASDNDYMSSETTPEEDENEETSQVQALPSIEATTDVSTSTGHESTPTTVPLDTQPVVMSTTALSDPQLVNTWRPEPEIVSDLAQEVHVLDDGEVDFGEDFGDGGSIDNELEEEYAAG